MDGTLIDSRADLAATVNHTRRDLGLDELPMDDVLCHVGQGAKYLLAHAIPEKADVVLTVAPYPMDVDLYQSQKALDTGKWALKEGGKIIMVSKCREGIGHPTFLQQLSSSNDPNKVLENLRAEYKLGYHKAAKMAEIATWASIWAVTGLDPEILSKANIRPFPTVADAMKEALAENPKARVIVLMDGSVTIPRVE